MPKIEWTPEHSVNVKIIDDQHKYFIGIINELYEAVYNLNLKKALGHIIDELASYGAFHFATEEKYFDLYSYEGAVEHKAQHQEMTQKIVSFSDRFKKGEDITSELIDFLEDWLVVHIDTYDKKYTKCFNDHGLF